LGGGGGGVDGRKPHKDEGMASSMMRSFIRKKGGDEEVGVAIARPAEGLLRKKTRRKRKGKWVVHSRKKAETCEDADAQEYIGDVEE